MRVSTKPPRWSGGRWLVLAIAVLVGAPALAAQSVLDQFSSENLAASAVGVDLGVLAGTRIGGTPTAALRAEFGNVTPHIRVVLGLSYFHGNLTNAELARFTTRLRSIVIDPTGDDTIRLGSIAWSDLTGDLDLQYVLLPRGRAVTPYVGLGVSVHVRHGSGAAIDGTFVQDALDAITPGVNGTVGAEFGTGRWRLAVEGRGVVASGLSTLSATAGLRYRWAGR